MSDSEFDALLGVIAVICYTISFIIIPRISKKK